MNQPSPGSLASKRSKREADFQEMLERCKDRGYEFPRIVFTRWGYRRVECVLCSSDMAPREYVLHYVRKHVIQPQNNAQGISQTCEEPTKPKPDKVRRGEEHGSDLAEPSQKEAWRQRARDNHARIVAAYSRKMVR